MENNKAVSFRRIRGRIVPIKVRKPDEYNRKKFGAATVAVGLAIPGATNRLSYFLKREAGRIGSLSKKTNISMKRIQERKFLFRSGDPDLFTFARRQKATEKVFNIGIKSASRADKLRKIAPHIKNIGVWTGASIIGSGLSRMFESKNEPELQGTIKELGFTAASAAAIYGSGDAALRAKAGRFLAKVLSRGKIK